MAHDASAGSRRDFLQRLTLGSGAGLAGLGLAAMLPGCSDGGAGSGGTASGAGKPLRCLFSNAGLQSTWCALGKTTAELWGKLLNVDVTWVDGEFDSRKQLDKLMAKVDDEWDYCCVQANQVATLEQFVSKLKKRNIPVLSMDVDIVERSQWRDVGVWIHITADQEFMGESSSRYMMQKIGGKGKVIHIGGLSAHSGAQGRMRGFEKALKDFPEIEVVGGGVRWCDWLKEKAVSTFQGIISQHEEKIAGAFFHSDDMALACANIVKNTPHREMVITAVDGQKEGLLGIRDGLIAATTVNPVCLIHMTALVVGQFIVRNGERVDEVPLEIITPGPLVSKETGNLEAMLFMADPRHCLV